MKKLMMALLALMVFAGCSSKEQGTALKIGIDLELTGSLADYGNSEAEGAELAIKLANADGGVLGSEIEMVRLDNQSDSAEAQSVFIKLADVEKVSAIISPATSGATASVYPLADEFGVPTVAASATADGITQDASGNVYKNAFRVCFLDSYQGIAMAKFAKQNLGATKAVVFGDSSSDYAKGLRENFVSTFTSNGGTIVAEESYISGDKDFNAALTKIAQMDFDVLYVPGYYSEAGLIIKQARALGIDCPIIGADGFDSPSLLEVAGADVLNDVYFTTAYTTVTTDEQILKFVADYKAEYNKDPDMFAALAYDATSLIIDAAKRAGSNDPAKIQEALLATNNFKGVTGSISFDDKHNAVKSVLVVELVNGVQTGSVEVK